ncbi:MAG: beta-lactamase family protein [Mogibacterium sp.]|nr:beta-lactamase family protein [Mogibacterium sp.]
MDKNAMMQTLARDAYEKGSFNGVWLYAEGGEIVSKGAYGFRDADDKLPMQEDSIYELASITKQFTAAAVMLLIRRGLLRLEDEITEFFPEIPYKGATVRHLLTHTAGVPDIYDSDWIVKVWEEEKKIPSNDIILRYLTESGEGPLFAPGEQFEYSNTGYNLLAELVQKVSGVPFEDFLKENIFEPAGMHSTGVYHLRRDGVPSDDFVRNLVREDGRYLLPDDSEGDYDVAAVDGLNGDDYVYTTVFDMLIWDRVLRDGRVLTHEEQQLMYTPCKLNSGEVYEEDGEGYGFGWGIIRDSELGLIVNHSGGMPGLNTWYERFLDADRVLLLLISRDSEDARACKGFWDGMRDVAKGKEPAPVRTIEDISIKDPDKSKWESFCGKYEKLVEDFPLEEVCMKDGDLYGKVVWDENDRFECKFYPIGGSTFGRKNGFVRIEFGDGCVSINETTCKKL